MTPATSLLRNRFACAVFAIVACWLPGCDSGGGGGGGGSYPTPSCGNGSCESGESLTSCPADCPCSSHTQCASNEICIYGDCQSAVNRVYKVAVRNAQLKETSNSLDIDFSAPDPYVEIMFPSLYTLLARTSTKSDDLTPSWNEYAEATVTAVGQEIYFCVYDADIADDDPLYFSGTANCNGYKNVVDFIRAGSKTWTGTADVSSLSVSIEPK